METFLLNVLFYFYKMQILTIVIFILICCFLFVEICKKLFPSKMNGGEFMKVTSDDISIIPSVSQIESMNYPPFEMKLKDSVEELKRRTEINVFGSTFTVEQLHHMKYISDAYIDLYGVWLNKGCQLNGFGVCEWNNKYRYMKNEEYTYGNNILTTIKNRMIQLGENKIMREEPVDVYIYIEFMYPTNGFQDIPKAYESIHRKTVNLISSILEMKNRKLFVLRFSMETEEVEEMKDNAVTNDFYYLYQTASENRFKRLMIPDTKKENGLAFDEYIEFTYNKRRYSIQIEHSEGYQNHKSNILDFLLYSLKELKHDVYIDDILKYFGFVKNKPKYQTSVKINSTGRIIQYNETNASELNSIIRNSAFYAINNEWFETNVLF